MNNKNQFQKAADVTAAEQSVIGAILMDNESIFRIPDLLAMHFYHREHQLIFEEARRLIGLGKTIDAVSLFEVLHARVDDCMRYLHDCYASVGSSASIERYAEIVQDRAVKRSLCAIGREMEEQSQSAEDALAIVDRMSGKVDALVQRKTRHEPTQLTEMLGNYVDVINDRMDGKIKPIATGFTALDEQLAGGLERGTLTVVAARPSMGKTAFALALGRNVSRDYTALFLSMEMARDQINDRNIAALGHLPVAWLRAPTEKDAEKWANLTAAFAKAKELNFYIDDQTGLNMLDIRAKSRHVKRRAGLDMLIIDQLSFITGGSTDKQGWEVVGEYTRGLLALAKELDIAVVLLCQLNRKVEERQNKRPIMSDLALSGSIEQDAANIIFLYRDEIYNPNTRDKGVCEIITTKQRQGQPGVIGLAYIGSETRFEDMGRNWAPDNTPPPRRTGGFD